MTAKQILIKYLVENGYDGLCLPHLECGCGLDDFAPCEGIDEECEPAIRIRKEDLSEEEVRAQMEEHGNVSDMFRRAEGVKERGNKAWVWLTFEEKRLLQDCVYGINRKLKECLHYTQITKDPEVEKMAQTCWVLFNQMNNRIEGGEKIREAEEE